MLPWVFSKGHNQERWKMFSKTESHRGHNHGTNYDLYKELATKNELKKKCLEDPTSKSVKEIYDEVVLRYLDHVSLYFSSLY